MNKYKRGALAYIPDWRADETLYSWAASFHSVHGNCSARDTGALLFDSEHACRDRDAPRNLVHFARVTHGSLGTAQSLLFNKTAIGLFIPFLSESRKQRLLEQLTQDSGAGWQLLCGMPASGLHDSSAMYFCEACVSEDLATWGLARWRLPHQLQGSWVCLEHGQSLCSYKSRRSLWLTPPTSHSGTRDSLISDYELDALKRIASLALKLIGIESLDVNAVRQALLLGLRDQGVITWRHPLNSPQLEAWFVRSPLAGWLRRSDRPVRKLADGDWIHDLLRDRVGDHPLKWMILWCTLFADEDESVSHQRFINPVTATYWDATGQATIWGASSLPVPTDIQDLIANASTLKAAAQTLGLSASTLRRRLSELGTNHRAVRAEAGFMRHRQKAVDTIRSYIATHPDCTRADVQRKCKAAVEWMRLNAPDAYVEAVGSLDDRRSRQMSLPIHL